MAGEEQAAAERSWARVAAHLREAIGALPRPNMEVVTNPKEMAKRLRELCKSLKPRLKQALKDAREMCASVYALLQDLAAKIKDLLARFFHYICDKVKRFYAWIRSLLSSSAPDDGAKAD